jgi:hypothetical protein
MNRRLKITTARDSGRQHKAWVERSETPGNRAPKDCSPRSARQHKAWGGAQRNPRNRRLKITTARDSGRQPFFVEAVARYRASKVIGILTWGSALRSTPGTAVENI